MSDTQEDRGRLMEKFGAALDELRDKALAAIDEGKNVELKIKRETASYLHADDGWLHQVPTGKEVYTVTLPGMTHGEAIAIAMERDEREAATGSEPTE